MSRRPVVHYWLRELWIKVIGALAAPIVQRQKLMDSKDPVQQSTWMIQLPYPFVIFLNRIHTLSQTLY